MAISGRFRDSRGASTRWVEAVNLAWASWQREDGRYTFISLRRSSNLITGELGFASAPIDLDALPLVTNPENAPSDGCRIQLGFLLHGHSKTWSAGGSEKALVERLDWIAHQLEMRLYAFMSATNPRV